MQGKPEIIAALNGLLVDELSAINQYLAHEAFARDSGYIALADLIEKRGESEREHADELLARIYMLGGSPDVAQVRDVAVGNTCVSVLENDLSAEVRAIERYSGAIALALSLGDPVTRALLEHIAAEESQHENELSGWIGQVNAIGEANFLSTMTGR